MKKFLKYTMILILAITFSGCLATTKVSPQAHSKYQQFQREDGTALLYIVRTSAFGGGAVTTFHSIDGKDIGELGNGDAHIIVALDPGKYKLAITGDLGMSGEYKYKDITLGANEDKLIKYDMTNLWYNSYTMTDFDRSAIVNTKLSNFTHLISPKAVAKKKEEHKLFQQTKESNSIKAYEEFQANYPSSKYAKEAKKFAQQKREAMQKNPKKRKEVHDNIQKYLNNKDFNGLIAYLGSDPEIKEFVQKDSDAYLLLSGPKELTIVKILQYKKNGISEAILSSQIKSLNKPYNKYSLDEIMILMKYGLTEPLITTIIDVTTQVEKEAREEQRQKQTKIQPILSQENAFEAQKREIQQNNLQQSNTDAQSNTIQDAVTSEAGKAIVGEIIKNLF